MNDVKSIISWLQTLPDDQDQLRLSAASAASAAADPKRLGKRKRDDAQEQHLVTPPHSVGDPHIQSQKTCQMATETPKKRRFDEPNHGHDPDTTPRAGGVATAPSCSSALPWSDTSSSISRASSASPKKQMLGLNLSDSGGYEMKALNVDHPPVPEAADLINSIQYIGRGMDILPYEIEPVISEQLKVRKLNYRDWRHSFQRPNENSEKLPGRLPTFEDVERIHRAAIKCQERRHDEYGWNYHVHLPLLESIFEDGNGQCDDFASTSCMTARPHRQFKIPSSPAKMIDLCVYASPLQPTESWASRLRRFSRHSPTQTINHTDFEFISGFPLILSIETKKPGVNWDKAQLQIGLWHAAQWSFLGWAVGERLARQGTTDGGETETTGVDEGAQEDGEDDMDKIPERQRGLETRKRAALSKLGFLPGIIVQGHRWHLVLSTYEPKTRKTTLWTDHQFGTTQRYLDVYSAIAGVRTLTAWSRDVYLPWFEANALD